MRAIVVVLPFCDLTRYGIYSKRINMEKIKTNYKKRYLKPYEVN
jgi:hypothetical protein